MRVNGQQLGGLLARELLPAYLVAGDEPLLVSEAAAQIRARARRDGFEQRDYFVAERGFDWQALTEGADNLSLFAARRIIELNLPTPRPGAVGGRVLLDLAQRPDPDRLMLIVTRKLDSSASRSAWVRAIDDGGAVIRVWPVERPQLPAWIRRRAQSRGLALSSATAEWMADRVEGNLLAADQEVRKLVLLLGEGSADDASVRDAVASNPQIRRLSPHRRTARGTGQAGAANPPRPARRGRRTDSGIMGHQPRPWIAVEVKICSP